MFSRDIWNNIWRGPRYPVNYRAWLVTLQNANTRIWWAINSYQTALSLQNISLTKIYFWTGLSRCDRQVSKTQDTQIGHGVICDITITFLQCTHNVDAHSRCYVFGRNRIPDHVRNKTQVCDFRAYTNMDSRSAYQNILKVIRLYVQVGFVIPVIIMNTELKKVADKLGEV